MDAFFAAVEQRDRPALRGKPVIVGADPRGRGVVSAASYEARAFGVHSAMPIRTAARLCPDGVFLPVAMEKYQAVSAQIMAILADFSPLVESVSVDEAFLDLTGCEALFGSAADAVRRMKARIVRDTGLTASAGLATSRFVAKVASDLEKPDGLVIVPPGQESAFLAGLPVERLWGVGTATARELHGLGVRTIRQLQQMPRGSLVRRLGRHGGQLHDLAFGRDDGPVGPSAVPRSMSAETTFGEDCGDPVMLRRTLRGQAERVTRELRAAGLAAACVTLKLRFAPFRTVTRGHTGEPTQDGLEMYRRAEALLSRESTAVPVRLIGVAASALVPAGSGQLPLLGPDITRRERLARAVDALTGRFGERAVRPAALLPFPRAPR
jgi:DNA polymerase-4